MITLVIAGCRSTQANATRATETLCAAAIGRMTSTARNARWRSTGGKSKVVRRAPSGPEASSLNFPLSSPPAVRFAVLIAGCGWAGGAYCIAVFGGFVTLFANVLDQSLTLNNSKHEFLAPPSLRDPKAVAGSNTLSASVGSSIAVTDVTFRSQPGLLAVFASASATATNTQNDQNRGSAADASALADANMADEWNLHVGHKVRKKHVAASFKLASQFTTTANGVNGTPASGFHDNVDSDARASVRPRAEIT